MNIVHRPPLARGRSAKSLVRRIIATWPGRRFGAALVVVAALFGSLSTPTVQAAEVTLLNVSCDLTRELYQDFNKSFAAIWKTKTGDTVTVKQSPGGSASRHGR